MYLPSIPEEKTEVDRIRDVIIDIETGQAIDIETGNPMEEEVDNPYVIPIESDAEQEEEEKGEIEDIDTPPSQIEDGEVRRLIISKSRLPFYQTLNGQGRIPTRGGRYRRPGSLLARRRPRRGIRRVAYPSPLRPRAPTPIVPPGMTVLDTGDKLVTDDNKKSDLSRSASSPTLKKLEQDLENRPNSTTPLLTPDQKITSDGNGISLNYDPTSKSFKWSSPAETKSILMPPTPPPMPPTPPPMPPATPVQQTSISQTFKNELATEVARRALRQASANLPPVPTNPSSIRLPAIRYFKPLPPLPKRPFPIQLRRRPLPPLPDRPVVPLSERRITFPTTSKSISQLKPLKLNLAKIVSLDNSLFDLSTLPRLPAPPTPPRSLTPPPTPPRSLTPSLSRSATPPPTPPRSLTPPPTPPRLPTPPLSRSATPPPLPPTPPESPTLSAEDDSSSLLTKLPPPKGPVEGWDIESLVTEYSEGEESKKIMKIKWLDQSNEKSGTESDDDSSEDSQIPPRSQIRSQIPPPPFPAVYDSPSECSSSEELELREPVTADKSSESSYTYEYDSSFDEKIAEIEDQVESENEVEKTIESVVELENDVELEKTVEDESEKKITSYSFSNSLVHRLTPINPSHVMSFPVIRTSLIQQIQGVDTEHLKELKDNFDEMNCLQTPPIQTIRTLEILKAQILTKWNDDERVNLAGLVSGSLVRKINEVYSHRYHPAMIVGRRYQWNFPKDRLLAVLDHLLLKYRGLAEDRKLIDFSEGIGAEMADVVEDFAEVKEEIRNFNRLNEILRNLSEGVTEAKALGLQMGLVDEPMKETLSSLDEQLSELRVNIDERRKPLIQKSQFNQAKFNYYAKIANSIKEMVCWEEFNKLEN